MSERINQLDQVDITDAGSEDKPQIYNLWQLCFHDPEAFAEYYYNRVYGHNRVLAARISGEIRSMVQLNPYKFWVNGQEVDSNYIVGVATHPDSRRQGLMGRLLIQALNELNEENMPFVYLMPASEQIYLPYQFTFIYRQMVAKLEFAKESLHAAGLSDFITKGAAVSDFIPMAVLANQLLIEKFDVFPLRDKRYYENLLIETELESGGIQVFYYRNQMAGYVAFAYDGDQLLIREFLVKDEYKQEASRWLEFYFAGQKGSMFFYDDQALQYETEVKPVIMGRITCVASFLKLIKVADDFELFVEITDPLIQSNNGLFRWTNEKVEKAEDTRMKPDAVFEISGLMSWLFGYESLKRLSDIDKLKGYTDCREKLAKVSLLSRPFINEIV